MDCAVCVVKEMKDCEGDMSGAFGGSELGESSDDCAIDDAWRLYESDEMASWIVNEKECGRVPFQSACREGQKLRDFRLRRPESREGNGTSRVLVSTESMQNVIKLLSNDTALFTAHTYQLPTSPDIPRIDTLLHLQHTDHANTRLILSV